MSSLTGFATGNGAALAASAWCSQKLTDCGTPSSVSAKSLAVSLWMGFPSLSLATTASTTNCTFTERVKLPPVPAGLFCPICCAPASAAATSTTTRLFRMRISESQPYRGLQAAHGIRGSRQSELRAVDRRKPPRKDAMVQQVRCVNACNQIELRVWAERAFERRVEAELARSGNRVSS